ncbi:MAG: hypothetical protein KAQ96_14100, partial [Thermoplasmata archaeon]|nr:hypothetical protein [Thermoplasmata archaeon]
MSSEVSKSAGAAMTCLTVMALLVSILSPLTGHGSDPMNTETARSLDIEDGSAGSRISIPTSMDLDGNTDVSTCLSDVEGSFTENLGQLGGSGGQYYCRGAPISVVFGTGWMAYDFKDDESERGVLIRIDFEGSDQVIPIGRYPTDHKSNFFLGNDPGSWVRGARNYQGVSYRDLWEGIDLEYYFTEDQLKYDLIVQPGADPSKIILSYEGVEDLSIDEATGDLLIHTSVGDLRDMAPVTFQDGTVGRTQVDSSFRLIDDSVMSIDVGSFDKDHPLTIDPGLNFSTFIGTDSWEEIYDFTPDDEGYIYVTGYTCGQSFPTTTGAY